MPKEETNNRLGALWRKKGNQGEFFTGELNLGPVKIPIIVFHNRLKKEGENYPDLHILKAEPRKPMESGEPTEAENYG